MIGSIPELPMLNNLKAVPPLGKVGLTLELPKVGTQKANQATGRRKRLLRIPEKRR